MLKQPTQKSRVRVIERADFQRLFDLLLQQKRHLFAPTVQNHAVVYDLVKTDDELPIGWIDHQSGGTYRLEKTNRPDLFAYHAGPQSWKRLLYPPSKTLWQAERQHSSFRITPTDDEVPKQAFIGVRPCELKALEILDKVLIDGPCQDLAYKAARENTLTVVVNCTSAGDTCFCASMDAGPKATSGYDLALTEIVENGRHYFVAESDSKQGARLLDDLGSADATDQQIKSAATASTAAAAGQSRHVDLDGIQQLLNSNTEHPRWDQVARRCLSCGNCTMVCPTCFCANVRDYTDLSGQQAKRIREWDSCFTIDFSYIFGGSIRNSGKSRYRQWMTHKLGNWIGQFGRTGCVGCGRCITWCPVGIDITEEARAIRESVQRVGATTEKR